jgi:hypothetical protein
LRQYVLLRHGPSYLSANVALQGRRQAIEQAVSVAEHIDRGELTAQLFFPLWMGRLEAQAGDPAQRAARPPAWASTMRTAIVS